MLKTVYDIGLTEDDFKFELISSEYINSEPEYRRKMRICSLVDDCPVNLTITMSVEFIQDLSSVRIDYEYYLNKVIKTNAIEKYINDIRIIRKQKLKKINEKW